MKRRTFLKLNAAASFGLPFASLAEAKPNRVVNSTPKSPLCVFTKPLDKFTSEQIVQMVSEAGYDGIDLAFRKKGHVLPENAKTDLPKFVNLAHKAGLVVPMAVTDINNADDPQAEEGIKMMIDNGITHYRMGGMGYNPKLSISVNLERFRVTLTKLAELNAKYGIHGGAQNHVGSNFSSSLWDLFFVIKDMDPRYMGSQYDIRHAMAEGMHSWKLPLRALAPHIRTTCIKDFTWIKQPAGNFKPVSVPLGEGIVDFKAYFKEVKENSINGPVSVHFEYKMLNGQQAGLPANDQVPLLASVMQKDLKTLKGLLS
jgi:L-ribulose-5-phosphate 3-epimerase